MKDKILKKIPIAGNGKRYMLAIWLILLVGMAQAVAQTQIFIGCGENSKDLATVSISNVPAGAIVTWHTGTPATAANKVANTSAVLAGKYYAAFYDAIGDCYSPTSAILQVIKKVCIPCGESIYNLTTVSTSATPAGAIVTWHTGTPATAANKVINTSAVMAGTYYAAFYDAIGGCYSPTSAMLQVIKTVCMPCGANTFNLSTVGTNAAPTGTIVTWHTAIPATSINKVVNTSAVPAGTYYAAFYDGVGDCYSPASAMLQVVKKICIPCGSTLADLTTVSTSPGPAGTIVTWHTGTPATNANKVSNPSAVPPGTYYPAYFHAGSNCYSPVGAAAQVEATAICAVLQPDVNIGLINKQIPGNVSVNDKVPAGTTYANPGAPANAPVGSNPVITISPDGTYTFQADMAGVYTYNVPVCILGLPTPCPTQQLVITVINPAISTNPPIVNIDVATTAYNTSVTVPILANDGPGNIGGALGMPTITGGTNPGASAIINGSGQLVYTPAVGFVGKDTIYYQVCEAPSGLCATTAVVITVNSPSATNNTAAADDYAVTISTTPVSGNVKNNDSDPQGNNQLITAQGSVSMPISLTDKGTYYINNDGSFGFTALPGFSGTVDIPYTTCDDGTPPACAKATLHILVKPNLLNPQPDINSTFVNVAVAGNVSTNDEVPVGTTYGSATSLPGNPNTSMPAINADGTYTFISSATGVFQFLVPVCAPGQTSGCATELLTITVLNATGINPPVANTDIATTQINTSVIINTLANDVAGTPGRILNPASVTLTDLNGGATGNTANSGTAVVNTTTGAITYTPAPGFIGIDTVKYSVCDNGIPSLCAEAYQIIAVEPPGAANSTTAADDYNHTLQGQAVSGDVKLNDTDPQGDAQTVTAQTTTVTNKGTLVLNTDGTYIFTPAAGFTGMVEFPYTICDNATSPACAIATLHILVTPMLTITGNVWHDVNAMTDGFVNNSGIAQTPPASPVPTGLRAYLVNISTGLIERVVPVNAVTGVYTFNQAAKPNTNYRIIITNVIVSTGLPAPVLAQLPAGWQHTGQKLGITSGSDSVNDGKLIVPVTTQNVINANFGIRHKGGDVLAG